jgi:hypothetical protein
MEMARLETLTGVGDDNVGEELVKGIVADDVVVPITPATKKTKMTRSKMTIARRELDVVSGDEVQMSTVRRSRRNRTG